MHHLLVACPDQAAISTIKGCFQDTYLLDIAASKESCFTLAAHNSHSAALHELIFLDLDLLRPAAEAKRVDYRQAMEPFWDHFPSAALVIMGPQGAIRDLVMAVKAGASNFLTYPLNPEEVSYVKEGLEEEGLRLSELTYLRNCIIQQDSRDAAQTNSPVMRRVLAQVELVASTRSTVLLTGETGTGKGVLAKLIHKLSKRSDQAFISVHCGAIPDNLVESELFGHEKGAFTGAVRRKLGKFEIAKGGTIFLDEVATLTPSAQVKLLQVLQERNFQRVGGVETIDADVRIVAATNQNLKDLSESGIFRSDLYYRLNVFPLAIPSLRQRTEDIPLLVQTFLQRLNQYYGKRIEMAVPEVISAMCGYAWPGNIRELENLIERAYILQTGTVLSMESFPSELFAFESRLGGNNNGDPPRLADVRKRGIELVERQYLQEVLSQNQGRIDRSAHAAGISTRQLHKLMTRHSLHKEDFR